MSNATTLASPEDHVSFALAKWAESITYDALSPAAIERVKLLLLDTFGCALGGSTQPDVELALAHCKEMGGKPACTVIGSGLRADPVTASFLDALCIRALDFNDVGGTTDPCHPSDVVPAALTLCEMLGHGGKELVLGTAIAHEVVLRLARLGVPGLRSCGWHHASLTAIAAPIVAGRILGLDAARIQHAVGISASRSMCLGAVTTGALTMMRNLADPMATRTGVESALLARRGATGPAHVLDGAQGMFPVLERGGLAFRAETLVADLPTAPDHHWMVLDCATKPYPIDVLGQGPVGALLQIVRERKTAAADVAEIRVEVVSRVAEIVGDPTRARSATRESADHSLPCALALALLDGTVAPAQFRDERLKDPALLAVMEKVRIVANPEFDARAPEFLPSRVTVVLRNGTEHAQQVDVPKGDPRDPMTRDEIKAKFDALGRGVIGQDRCDAAGDLVMGLEHEASLEGLLALLVA